MSERQRLTAEVDCGDGAFMTIIDPASFTNGSVGWRLRNGNAESVKLVAAQLLDSYDYLLSGEITAAEAIRRLRLLRRERYQICKDSGHD